MVIQEPCTLAMGKRKVQFLKTNSTDTNKQSGLCAMYDPALWEMPATVSSFTTTLEYFEMELLVHEQFELAVGQKVILVKSSEESLPAAAEDEVLEQDDWEPESDQE